MEGESRCKGVANTEKNSTEGDKGGNSNKPEESEPSHTLLLQEGCQIETRQDRTPSAGQQPEWQNGDETGVSGLSFAPLPW